MSFLLSLDRSQRTRASIRVACDGSGVNGVACFGRQLVLTGEPGAARAFAHDAGRHDGERTIVGPYAAVRAFWEVARDGRRPPRIVRERQLVMALDRQRLQSADTPVNVRTARPSEWAAVAQSSAEMIEHELGYDPRRGAPDFGGQVRAMIARDRWWVGEWQGRLCFFCSIGPWCSRTAQLQGVWTPPELRRQGFATAAFTRICDRLLSWLPTLSLYVNDFNEPAIALYRRVGFEHVADFQTLLF